MAASYARYSSDQQDVSSIDQQQRKCREAAERNGHEIPSRFEFGDEAVSGTKVRRDGLQRMMDAARAGEVDVIYFESLSRLARELVLSLSTLKELVYVQGVRIVRTSEGIDLIQAGWEFMAEVRS